MIERNPEKNLNNIGKETLKIAEGDVNIAIIDNLVSESQMTNLQGSKLRKTVTAGSVDTGNEKEIASDKKTETRVISIKHKR